MLNLHSILNSNRISFLTSFLYYIAVKLHCRTWSKSLVFIVLAWRQIGGPTDVVGPKSKFTANHEDRFALIRNLRNYKSLKRQGNRLKQCRFGLAVHANCL